MPDKADESDKKVEKGDAQKPGSDGAAKEAAGGQQEAAAKVKEQRRELASRNESIWGSLDGIVAKIGEKLTIIGLEGISGKGAALSESAEKGDSKPDAGSDKKTPDGKPETGSDIKAPDGKPETGSDIKAPDGKPETGSDIKAPDGKPDVQAKTLPGGDSRKDEVVEKDPEVKSVERQDARTRVIEYKDGSRVTQEDGKVTKVTGPPPESETREFGYDGKSGELNYIKHPDGAEWTRTPPGDEWTASGTGEKWTGKVAVDQKSGDISWKNSESGAETTEYADGRAVTNKDGVTVTEAGGRVVKTEGPERGDPPGRDTREYGYSADGELNYIKHPDGAEWTRTPPGNEWTKVGSNEKWTGEVSVDRASGALQYRDADGKTITERPDGVKVTRTEGDGVTVTEHPDGTKVTERKGTKITETPDGKKVTEDADGKRVTENSKDKTTITEKDGRIIRTEGPPPAKETYEYGYNDKGELDSIKHPDGKKWTRTPPESEWSTTDAKTGQTAKWSGEVSIDGSSGAITWSDASTGQKVTDYPDGSRQEKKSADAPTVSTDARGNVTRYEYPPPDSRAAEYKYDDKGRLSEAHRPDGSTWKLNDKGIYEVYDAKGKMVARAANPEVDEDGTFSYDGQGKDGRVGRHSERVDGTSESIYEDGSRIERNAAGKPSEIEYPPKDSESRGETRQFEYDKSGNLSGIKDRDGTYWKPGPGEGQWSQYADAEGGSPTGKSWEGTVSVDAGTGEYTYRSSDGTTVSESGDGSRSTLYADGSSIVERPDGSRVERDANQRVTEMTYPPRKGESEGETRKYEYDKNGNLKGITDRDGTYWAKDPGSDTWRQYSDAAKGEPTGKTWEGQVVVDKESGDYAFAGKGENFQVIEKADGSRLTLNIDDKGKPDGSGVIEKADGSRVTVDTSGRPTKVVDASGKSTDYRYDEKGRLSEVRKAGEDGHKPSTWKLDDSGTWRNEYGEKYKGDVAVDADGNLHYYDGNGETVERTDGTKAVHPRSGGEVVTGADGKIAEMTDARGEKFTFEYDAATGEPTRVAAPDGTVWTRGPKDEATGQYKWEGHNVQTGERQEWSGNIEIDEKGVTYSDGKTKVIESVDGSKITKDTDPASPTYGRVTEESPEGDIREKTKPVDRAKVEADAEALWEATKGGWTGAGTDKKTVDEILKHASEAEKQKMDAYLYEKYGWHLEDIIRDEMEDAELDETLRYLHRKDEDDKSDNAGRIHTALIERQQYLMGRADEAIEKDMRETIAKLDADGIKKMEDEYRERYGSDIWEDIANNPDVSQATKDAIEIYRKGADKRTDADTLKLADIALANQDLQMFQEAMRNASPEARKEFMDNGGDEKMKAVFSGYVSDADYKVAADYAQYGKETVATQIENNTSWAGDSETAIEKAFESMTKDEREKYTKGKEIADKAPPLTAEEAEARDYYEKVRAAIEGASGNQEEIAKWEDMIATKGGSILSKLASHAGSVYDDSVGTVLSDVENMTDEQWKQAKEEYDRDPEAYRKKMEESLDYLSGRDRERVIAAFEQKMKAITYEQAQEEGRRSVTDMIADAAGTFSDNEKDVLDAVGHMTDEEQKKYREDPEYRAKVDELVAQAMEPGPERAAAERILSLVDKGIDPPDIITTLNKHAMDTDTDEAAVIGDIEKAFKDSEERGEKPSLRERIENPQTDEDRAVAEAFKASATAAVGAFDYDYVDKAIKGELSLADRAGLNSGVFDDDEIATYEDVAKASKEEREKIVNDPEYREKALGHLNEEEQEIALNAAEQGEMRPEDYMRAYMVGAGTSEQEIKDMLKGMTDEQKEEMMREYARKYGASLTADIVDEMGGRDQKDALRAMAPEAKSADEAYTRALDDYLDSRSGVGSDFVDSVWDGTGYQADDAMNGFAAAMEEAAKSHAEMTPEDYKEYEDRVHEAVDAFVESKAAAADALVDVAMGVGGLATGGSLWVWAVAGAAFKVAAKATIMGEDYDWSSSDVLVDAASGATDAAMNIVGPGEFAAVMKIGKEAAEKASKEAAEKIVKEVGEKALAQADLAGAKTGRETLESGTKKLVNDAIGQGSKDIDEQAARALAKDAIGKGVKEQATAGIGKSIEEAAGTGALKAGGKETIEDGVKKLADKAIDKGSRELPADTARALAKDVAPAGSGAEDIEAIASAIKYTVDRAGTAGVSAKAASELAAEIAGKAASKEEVAAIAAVIRKASADLVPQGISEKAALDLAKKAAAEGASEAEVSALAKAIKEQADAAIKSGVEDIDLAARAIKESAEKTMQEEGRSWLAEQATKYAATVGSAAAGGGASGAIMGAAAWDHGKSFEENMAMLFESTLTAAAFGAVGGAAFTAVADVAGTAFKKVAERAAEKAEAEAKKAAAKVSADAPAAKPAAVKADEPAAKPAAVKADEPQAKPAAVKADEPQAKPADVKADEPQAKPADVKADEPQAKPADVKADEPQAKPADVKADEPQAKPVEAGVETKDRPDVVARDADGNPVVYRPEAPERFEAVSVTKQELAADYQKVDINGQAKYIAKDGTVYSAPIETPSGGLMLPVDPKYQVELPKTAGTDTAGKTPAATADGKPAPSDAGAPAPKLDGSGLAPGSKVVGADSSGNPIVYTPTTAPPLHYGINVDPNKMPPGFADIRVDGELRVADGDGNVYKISPGVTPDGKVQLLLDPNYRVEKPGSPAVPEQAAASEPKLAEAKAGEAAAKPSADGLASRPDAAALTVGVDGQGNPILHLPEAGGRPEWQMVPAADFGKTYQEIVINGEVRYRDGEGNVYKPEYVKSGDGIEVPARSPDGKYMMKVDPEYKVKMPEQPQPVVAPGAKAPDALAPPPLPQPRPIKASSDSSALAKGASPVAGSSPVVSKSELATRYRRTVRYNKKGQELLEDADGNVFSIGDDMGSEVRLNQEFDADAGVAGISAYDVAPAGADQPAVADRSPAGARTSPDESFDASPPATSAGIPGEVTLAGSRYRSEDGVTWKTDSGEDFKGSVSQGTGGELHFKTAKGETVIYPDGKRVEINSAGGRAAFDEHGRVSETIDANGATRSFEYDENGELDGFVDEHGTAHARSDQGQWYAATPRGDSVEPQTRYEVDADGNFTKKQYNDIVTFRVDGKSDIRLDGGRPRITNLDIDTDRSALAKTVDHHFSDPLKQEVLRAMADYEALARQAGTSELEVAEFFYHSKRILDDNSAPESSRRQLAESILRQAADTAPPPDGLVMELMVSGRITQHYPPNALEAAKVASEIAAHGKYVGTDLRPILADQALTLRPIDLPGGRSEITNLFDSTSPSLEQQGKLRKAFNDLEAKKARGEISASDLAEIYGQVKRLMQQGDRVQLSAADRALIASDVLRRAGDPNASISSPYSRWSDAVLKAGGLADSPVEAARLAADIIERGTHKLPDGSDVVLHNDRLSKFEIKDIASERQALESSAFAELPGRAEKKRFKESMDAFEKRAADQGMPPWEVAETYRQVQQLIDSPGNPHLSQADRVRLAEQVMHQAADPRVIDQGFHKTCNVTTIEKRLYMREPSEAARLVREVATTGQYVTADGAVIRMTGDRVRGGMVADTEASIRERSGLLSSVQSLAVDGKRSHASQIFQTTAVNANWQVKTTNDLGQPVRPGDLRYEKHTPTSPADTGERVIDYSGAQPRQVVRNGELLSGPGMAEEEISRIARKISGAPESGYIFHSDTRMSADPSTVPIRSEQDLRSRLEVAREQGKLPVIVAVHTGNEPFFSDSGAGRAGGSGGWHVVIVDDFDPATGKASVLNSWGRKSDHRLEPGLLIDSDRRLTVSELYRATSEPRPAGAAAGVVPPVYAAVGAPASPLESAFARGAADTRTGRLSDAARDELVSKMPEFDLAKMTAEQRIAAVDKVAETPLFQGKAIELPGSGTESTKPAIKLPDREPDVTGARAAGDLAADVSRSSDAPAAVSDLPVTGVRVSGVEIKPTADGPAGEVPVGRDFSPGMVKIPYDDRAISPALRESKPEMFPSERPIYPINASNIKRKQGFVGRDEGGTYFRNNNPHIPSDRLFGTYVREPGSVDFRRLGDDEKIYLRPGMELVAGYPSEMGVKIHVQQDGVAPRLGEDDIDPVGRWQESVSFRKGADEAAAEPAPEPARIEDDRHAQVAADQMDRLNPGWGESPAGRNEFREIYADRTNRKLSDEDIDTLLASRASRKPEKPAGEDMPAGAVSETGVLPDWAMGRPGLVETVDFMDKLNPGWMHSPDGRADFLSIANNDLGLNLSENDIDAIIKARSEQAPGGQAPPADLRAEGAFSAAPAIPEAFSLPDTVPPAAADVFKMAGIAEERWADLVADIRQSKLAAPGMLHAFDDAFNKATARWTDISHLSREVELAGKKLSSERSMLDDRLTARAARGSEEQSKAVSAWISRRDPQSLKEVEQAFAGDAVVAAVVDRFKKAREANAQAELALSVTIKGRVDELQRLMDDIAIANGLPTVKVGVISGLDPTGDYHGLYNDGHLQLKRTHFMSSDPRPDLFREALYHEFVHNEQDYLVLRAVLDDMDARGKPITSGNVGPMLELKKKVSEKGGMNALSAAERQELAPLAELWSTYTARAGKGLSDEHLDAILKAREGGRRPDEPYRPPDSRKLTADERARADKLADAFKNKTPLDKAYSDMKNDLGVTRSALKQVSEPAGAYQALATLSNADDHTRNLSRRLFGSDTPPQMVQDQIDAWRKQGMPQSPDPQARAVLEYALRVREYELATKIQKQYQSYVAGRHETEAFVIPRFLPERQAPLPAQVARATPVRDGGAPASSSPARTSADAFSQPDSTAMHMRLDDTIAEAPPPFDRAAFSSPEREALAEIAAGSFATASERDMFADLMKDFDTRAARENIPADRVADTYIAIAEVMSTGDVRLASQLMQYAADPDLFEQGLVLTGGFKGNGQSRLYLSDPLSAAKAAADLRVKGEHRPAAGQAVMLADASSLKASPVDISGERDAVIAAAKKNGSRPELAEGLEPLVNEFRAKALARALPPAEIAASYRHLADLLAAPDGKPLPADARLAMAESLLRRATGETDDSPFGRFADSLYGRDAYASNPGEPIRLAADLASGAEHVMADGRVVSLTEERLGKFAAKDVLVEKDALAKAAAAMPPAHRGRFSRHMEALQSPERGLSPSEIAETYAQVRRLLEDSPGAPVSAADRMKLAEQVMYQAAHPNQIDQGFNGTCNVTAVEKRVYSKTPSEAARLVAEVSTTGRYVTADGFTVKMDSSTVRGGIAHDKEAIRATRRDFDFYNNDLKRDNHRSHASQIFQATAVNAHWQKAAGLDEFGRPYRAGDIRYELRTPVDPSDTGERLTNYATKPPSPIRPGGGPDSEGASPHLRDQDIAGVHASIGGAPEKAFFIANKQFSFGRDSVAVGSADEMAAKLAALKQEGRLPAIVKVFTENEPFFSDSGMGSKGGAGGFHVVLVDDIDGGKVSVRNSWGRKADHAVEGKPPKTVDNRITIEELYQATKVPPKPALNPDPAALRSAQSFSRYGDGYTGAFNLKELWQKAKEKVGLGDNKPAAGRQGQVADDEPWYRHQFVEDGDDIDSDALPGQRVDEPGQAGIASDAGNRQAGEGAGPQDGRPAGDRLEQASLADEPPAPTRQVVDSVAGVELRPGRELILGSGRSADVEIGNSTVDYNHARVRVDADGNVYVQDLDSVNGTRIRHADGTEETIEPMRAVRLRPGDRLMLGDAPVGVGSRDVRIEAPRTEPAIEIPRPGQAQTHYQASTAARAKVDSIGGVEMHPGSEFTIGRDIANDLEITNPEVSSRHARVRVDDQGRVFVSDLNSTNGTFVRHADGLRERIPPGQEVELRPEDQLELSSQPIATTTRLEPSFAVRAGGRDVPLAVGYETPLGDGSFGLAPEDAAFVMREDGLHLRVDNDAPVYVNGNRVPAGSEVPVQPRDSIAIGEPSRVVNGQKQGEWVNLFPSELQDVPRPADPLADSSFQAAIAQANSFAAGDEVAEPLLDGFQTGGRRKRFDGNGDFEAGGDRHAFVVDRQNDQVLRAVIEEAKARIGDRDPHGNFHKLEPGDPDFAAKSRRMADELTDYVHDLFEPPGWSGSGQLDDWVAGDNGFYTHRQGGRVFLGEYIKQGKGVCIQQAATMKVIGDELGLDISVVRGAGLRRKPDAINHAWVEVRIPGEPAPLVYDPRNNYVKAKPYGDQSVGFHRKGFEIEQEKLARQAAERLAAEQAQLAAEQAIQAIRDAWTLPKAPAEASLGGRALAVPEGATIEIGRNSVRGTPQERAIVSSRHAEITRHNGSLWLADLSSNGTFINGLRVPPNEWVSIGPDDIVTLGAPDGPRLDLQEQ